jgi:hypothetical protein
MNTKERPGIEHPMTNYSSSLRVFSITGIIFGLVAMGGCAIGEGSNVRSKPSGPSISAVTAELQTLVNEVAGDFPGKSEYIGDERQECDPYYAPGPDNQPGTYVRHTYNLGVSPLPNNFMDIVTKKVRPRFPESAGWTAKERDGSAIMILFEQANGTAIAVGHEKDEGAAVGIGGRSRCVLARPGDLSYTPPTEPLISAPGDRHSRISAARRDPNGRPARRGFRRTGRLARRCQG